MIDPPSFIAKKRCYASIPIATIGARLDVGESRGSLCSASSEDHAFRRLAECQCSEEPDAVTPHVRLYEGEIQ